MKLHELQGAIWKKKIFFLKVSKSIRRFYSQFPFRVTHVPTCCIIKPVNVSGATVGVWNSQGHRGRLDKLLRAEGQTHKEENQENYSLKQLQENKTKGDQRSPASYG